MQYDADPMRDLAILFLHLITNVTRMFGPGGARSIVAKSLLIKQQLLIVNRSRERASNLRTSDRIIAGLCAMLMRPGRILRSAVILKNGFAIGRLHDLVKSEPTACYSCASRIFHGPPGCHNLV
jgi:putative transposase